MISQKGIVPNINTPVDEIISRMLITKTAQEQIKSRAKELNIQQEEYVFNLYDHYYEAAPGIMELTPTQRKSMKLESEDSIPYFLGNFKN